MRKLRTGTPSPEKWGRDDVMSHLECDSTTAEKLMKECRGFHGIHGYDEIEKNLFLDFINQKQRAEREREARHQADIATVRQVSVLEEQVKTLREQTDILSTRLYTLKEMCDSSSVAAHKAHTQSLVANIIAFLSIAVAIISLILKCS